MLQGTGTGYRVQRYVGLIIRGGGGLSLSSNLIIMGRLMDHSVHFMPFVDFSLMQCLKK